MQGVPGVEHLPLHAHQIPMQGLSPQCPVLMAQVLMMAMQGPPHTRTAAGSLGFRGSQLLFGAGWDLGFSGVGVCECLRLDFSAAENVSRMHK